MPEMQTAVDMFAEMAARGMITPAAEQIGFSMPTTLRQVPTITTYGTAEVPVDLGAYRDAGLEARS